MRFAGALLALALVGSLSQAAERTGVLVLDRSASLRYADEDGRGPRLLALALALSLETGQRLAVVPTHGEALTPGEVPSAPAALGKLLRAVLADDHVDS